jgi:hypothetical protein
LAEVARRYAFFGVSPLYFFAEEEASPKAVSPELAVALQDEDLRAIREMVESARVIEGLDSGSRASQRGS